MRLTPLEAPPVAGAAPTATTPYLPSPRRPSPPAGASSWATIAVKSDLIRERSFPYVVAAWLILGLGIVLIVPGLARRMGTHLAEREGLAINEGPRS